MSQAASELQNLAAQERTVVFKMADGEFSRTVLGETGYGSEEILLASDDNLLDGLEWEQKGFTVETLFSREEYVTLSQAVCQIVLEVLRELGIEAGENFQLEDYHTLVDDEIHQTIAQKIQSGFPVSALGIPETRLEKRISEILGLPAECRFMKGQPERKFNLRIVRPLSNDNNPPHRDVWLDHLRDAVNIYIPIAGSSHQSSLPLVPGSHFWRESDIERTLQGAKIAGISYRVPSVVGAKKEMIFTRPNPGPNQFLIFSPYLIHGGGINFKPGVTRVSLEARFWRKTD